MTAAPVHFTDAIEKPIADEDQVHRDSMRPITGTTSEDYGHAVRSAITHPLGDTYYSAALLSRSRLCCSSS